MTYFKFFFVEWLVIYSWMEINNKNSERKKIWCFAAFNTLTNLVYNMNRYEEIVRLGMN